MSYTPTTWVNGTTPVNQTNMNHLETQYTESTLSFNPDFFTAGFTVSGLVASADGTTLNQLDVTAGTSYLLQSSDGTTRQRKTLASIANQFLTSAVNSTYYLWLNPDGTFTFDNTHTIPGSPPQTNSLPIAQATTNASGNILAVTDKRVMTAAVFPNMASPSILSFFGGSLLMAPTSTSIVFASRQSGAATGLVMQAWSGSAAVIVTSFGGQFSSALSWVDNTGNIHFGGNGANNPQMAYFGTNNATQMWTPQAGSAQWIEFVTWNGTIVKVPFGVGTAAAGNAAAYVNDAGNIFASELTTVSGGIGQFDVNSSGNVTILGGLTGLVGRGVPIIPARPIETVVSNNALTTIASLTVPNVGTGTWCEVSGFFNIGAGNTNNGVVTFEVVYTDPYLGTSQTQFLTLSNSPFSALNATALTKGAGQYDVYQYTIYVKANFGILVKYQNNVAGTISDTVSAVIKYL